MRLFAIFASIQERAIPLISAEDTLRLRGRLVQNAAKPRPTSQHGIYGGFTMHNATCIDSLCWRSSKTLILENQHCFKSNTILTADCSLRGRPTIQEPSKSRRPPASESSNIHSSQVLRAASGCYTFRRASSTVRSEKGWPA